jgi:sirohydrochlorin cobaltochelatase
MKTTLLIVGHGSRDAAANAELEALVDAYRSTRPAVDVAHGYVELADPPLRVALHELARRSDHVVVMRWPCTRRDATARRSGSRR